MNATDTVFVCLLHVVSPWAAWIDLNLFCNLLLFFFLSFFLSFTFHRLALMVLSGKTVVVKDSAPSCFCVYRIRGERSQGCSRCEQDKSLDRGRRNAPPAFCSPISICLSSETSQLLLSTLSLSLISPALLPPLPPCFLPFSTFNTSLTDS